MINAGNALSAIRRHWCMHLLSYSCFCRNSFFFVSLFFIRFTLWEGAESYMGVEENVKLKFVGIVSAVILLAPIIIDFLLSMLMPGFYVLNN